MRWTAPRLQRLDDLHAAGARPDEIAAAFGVTRSAIKNQAHLRGLKFGPSVGQISHVPSMAKPEPPAGLVERVAAYAADHEIKFPRDVAAYAAVVELGCGQRATGRALGVSQMRVSQMVTRTEERRDDPVFDAWMDRLGDWVRQVAA